MSRIYVPTRSALDWKARLADPELHWVPKHSAYELAVTWEAAQKKGKLSGRGLPQEVAILLDQQTDTNGASLIFAAPEHKVALKGQGYASQTDLWALLKSPGGLVSMAVEGKAGEPFDMTVEEWLDEADNQRSADNRQVRLDGLGETLGLSAAEIQSNLGSLRYQLLHRTASAILEAQRCGATHAIMLVQSFTAKDSQTPPKSFADFEAFAYLMGAKNVVAGQLLSARSLHGIRLSLAWLVCPLTASADAVLTGAK